MVGDWDQNCLSIEETYIHKWVYQRYHFGVNWEDSLYYEKHLNSGRFDQVAFRERCAYYDSLFESMKKHGYRTQRELNSKMRFVDALVNEICVDIGRDGSYLLADSKHRLAMAKILGFEVVPACILVRHQEWVDGGKA